MGGGGGGGGKKPTEGKWKCSVTELHPKEKQTCSLSSPV